MPTASQRWGQCSRFECTLALLLGGWATRWQEFFGMKYASSTWMYACRRAPSSQVNHALRIEAVLLPTLLQNPCPHRKHPGYLTSALRRCPEDALVQRSWEERRDRGHRLCGGAGQGLRSPGRPRLCSEDSVRFWRCVCRGVRPADGGRWRAGALGGEFKMGRGLRGHPKSVCRGSFRWDPTLHDGS